MRAQLVCGSNCAVRDSTSVPCLLRISTAENRNADDLHSVLTASKKTKERRAWDGRDVGSRALLLLGKWAGCITNKRMTHDKYHMHKEACVRAWIRLQSSSQGKKQVSKWKNAQLWHECGCALRF
jgi:hypothetical protein